ncbi:hypothetical protein scyTo_0006258 [Scyliorhinus torazame]|uniref:Uncharacterized protein n=1 Tax=Scyliorhinus torazame TaxID=75743 RepID=A0A401PGX1_SCYTO|nr:hypothetical protein [Scyliorhinus torazame]
MRRRARGLTDNTSAPIGERGRLSAKRKRANGCGVEAGLPRSGAGWREVCVERREASSRFGCRVASARRGGKNKGRKRERRRNNTVYRKEGSISILRTQRKLTLHCFASDNSPARLSLRQTGSPGMIYSARYGSPKRQLQFYRYLLQAVYFSITQHAFICASL